MRDCGSAEMRDGLPDLMHGTLPPERAAELRTHLQGCSACRAELELLMRVRDAGRAPAIPVDRIVASLPRYRAPSAWRRVVNAPALRIAATIVLVAGGAAVLLRRAPTAPEPVSIDTVAQMREPEPREPAAREPSPRELSLGETFVGVSDSALVSLVESIDDLEAVLNEEPERIEMPLLLVEGS